MTDADITYRWLTQAELDAMLDEAFASGAEAMREAAYSVARRSLIDGDDDVCADTLRAIRTLPLPKANP